jgi:hypothetical protein
MTPVPYFFAILGLLMAGFVFRKVLMVLVGALVLLIALSGATIITFGASVLLLGRIDAIIAGGSGWFEIPSCIAVWIMTFSSISSFLLPKGSAAKSTAA